MLQTLLFSTLFLAGSLLSILRNPAYAFITYQMVYCFYPQGRWWGSMIPDLRYSFITVALMALLYVVNMRELNRNRFRSVPQLVWATVLGALFLLVYPNAVHPIAHHDGTIYFLKLLLIMFIAFKLVNSEKMLNSILYAYVFGVSYISFIVNQTGRNSGGRVEGIGTVDSGGDSNYLAATIAPAAILTLYYVWSSRDKRIRLLMLFAGALIVNAIILINSRGAFLALFVSSVYFMSYLFFSHQQRKGQKMGVIALAFAGLLGLGFLLDESAIERFKSIGVEKQAVSDQESGSTRVFFWSASIEMSKDYPLGAGFRGFNVLSPEYIPYEVDTGESRNRSVHSTWFQALSEVGYPGLLALIMMLFYSFKTLFRCRKSFSERGDIDRYYKIVAIEASLLTYMVSMTFINRLTAEVLYWLVLFSACAYNIYILQRNEQLPKNVNNIL